MLQPASVKVYIASTHCLEDPALYQKALSVLPPQRVEYAERMKIESGKRLSAGAGLLLMAALADLQKDAACSTGAEPLQLAALADLQKDAACSTGAEHLQLAVPADLQKDAACSAAAEPLRMAAPADLQKAEADSESGDIRCGVHRAGSGIEEFRSIRFGQGEHGKPYLPDYPQVHFNLSHSGERVMCIMGPAACGCDVEQVDRNQKQIDLVIRCLAESEQRQAARSAVDFFRIWTLKESILKLSGEGITIPLNSFEVSLKPLSVRQDFFAGPVELKEYDEREYRCACALAGSGLPDEMTYVALEELLS